ncbi:MAG TPA: cytochrome c oxidase accessory protein CcoG [Azospirillaceae bacterium]|nr:cytochrome c oxidase accessory protein CcoG [Azospirillaceae bacterium]
MEQKIQKAAPAATAPAVGKPAPQASLYASRVKVHPRSVKGLFRSVKWAMLTFCLAVYYLVPWIRWDRGEGAPNQAVLIDLAAPRAYFFGIEIWPQEVYYITGLMVLGALALFLVTSLFGRLWCGYACPQTVWTDLFMLVERWIEGDRGARIRLDKQPWTIRKIAKRTAKHAAWLVISALTGGAVVMYFGDAPTVVADIFTGRASVELYFFVGMFTATTYLLAGWAREQVCTYMCPWPRFQGAMLDSQSMVVTYQAWRGEKRGPLLKGAKCAPQPVAAPGEPAPLLDLWAGRGDCIDCGQCVAVCPTGIDIRDGLQVECIGCGLCIDSCNEIMAKVNRPPNLIRFDTLANQEAKAKGGRVGWTPVRARTVIYAAALVLVGAIMLVALTTRATLHVSVLRDRAPLFVTLSDGDIRNAYTIKVVNKRRERLDLVLAVQGIEGAAMEVQGLGFADRGSLTVEAKPDAVETFRVFVTAPKAALAAAKTPVTFTLREPKSGEGETYDAVFLGPKR